MGFVFNPLLTKTLDLLRNTLGASSCTFYLRDAGWPAEFRLVAMSGVRFEEPMFGFIEMPRSVLDGNEEVFQLYSDEEPIDPSFFTSEIPESNRRLFGSFHEREGVKSFARVVGRDVSNEREAVLFVNYCKTITFDDQLKSSIRSAAQELLKTVCLIDGQLTETDATWRSEATRIVSPSQTVTNINFYTLDEPDVFFDQVIEAALKVLNIPPGAGLGVIHLYNAEHQTLELHGSYGEIEFPKKAQEHSVKKGDGVVSWVALTKRALVIQDLAKSEFRRIHVWLNENTKSELAVPLEAGGELVGTMCLECTEINKFMPHHVRSVWYAANKAALAYQLHQLSSMNRKLLNLCWQATAVKGGAHVSLDDVATLAKNYLKASSCDISRYNQDTGKFDIGAASYAEFVPQVRPDGWTNFLQRSKLPIWIGNIKSATEFTVHSWDQDHWGDRDVGGYPKELNSVAVEGGIRSALGIPIMVHDYCVGIAWVSYKRERLECPKPGLMSLALGFAAEAGLVLDSIQRQEVDLKERNEVDSVGDQIFTAIHERWQLDESDLLEAHVCSRPFHWKLGGDFYAGKVIDEKTAGILLIDGQGHGVGGSLHMLPLMTAFESVSESYSTAHVVSQLAKTAEALGVRGSAIYCIFTSINNRKWLSVTSAGHESLIVFKKEERSRWSVHYYPESQAPMLGHPLKEPFMDHRMELSVGDVLVGYTDGIAEQNQPFDATRLAAFVVTLLNERPAEPKLIAEAIVEESQKRHLHSFDDDATVFVVRMK